MTWRLRWAIATFFVVVIVLVTAVATAYGIRRGSDEIRQSVIERQRESAQSTANVVDYFFASTHRALESTASLVKASELAPDVNEATVGAALDPLVAYLQGFSRVLLVDETGTSHLGRPEGMTPAPPLADDAAFQDARNTFSAALSLDPARGDPYWAVPVPASQDLAPRFFLVGILDPQRIEELLLGNLAPDVDAALLNVAGDVIAATDATLRPETLTAHGVLDDLASGRALERDDVSARGEVLVTMRPTPNHPAQALLMSPTSEIDLLQAQLVRNAIVTALGLVVAAGLLGLVVANRISRPLQDVRGSTRRMRGGDLSVRVEPKGALELQELALDFNALGAALAKERAKLLQLQTELETKVDRRTGQLDEKRKEMELFFYGVSHDFKGPLIAISALSQLTEEALAKERVDRADALELVRGIRRATKTLETLINELLQFARAERVAPTYRTVDVSTLLRTVVDEARPFAQERHVRVEVQGGRVRAETDPDRLRHIVANLVQNAIKYLGTKRSARVRVAWASEGDNLVVRVTDNGPGISEKVQRELFRPFARHGGPSGGAPGAGLGLSIVKRFAESLQGQVQLTSAEGQGSTFAVRLPLKRPVTPEEET